MQRGVSACGCVSIELVDVEAGIQIPRASVASYLSDGPDSSIAAGWRAAIQARDNMGFASSRLFQFQLRFYNKLLDR